MRVDVVSESQDALIERLREAFYPVLAAVANHWQRQLGGDLRTAATYLRSAAGQPGADSRVRQNLALVVGLQGRFDEAERIASQELSPDQAQANVAYLRRMLSQQNAWNQLKAQDGQKTAAAN